MKSTRYTIEDLRHIMKTLRSPEGCPWDRAQTPESLTPFAVEEALELEDAIHEKSDSEVCDELGDLLFQIIFQSQMAEEAKKFTFDDVVQSISRKMIERHPHVFAKKDKTMTDQGVMKAWEHNKNKDKGSDIFGMPKNFPSLLAAFKIGKKSRSIDFDWNNAIDTYKHFQSEARELKETLKPRHSKKHQEEELGDTLFTLVQVARHLQIDPEKALRRANKKIVGRIHVAFAISKLSWKEFCKLTPKQKDKFWNLAKMKSKLVAKKR